jgi:hypothetical protein
MNLTILHSLCKFLEGMTDYGSYSWSSLLVHNPPDSHKLDNPFHLGTKSRAYQFVPLNTSMEADILLYISDSVAHVYKLMCERFWPEKKSVLQSRPRLRKYTTHQKMWIAVEHMNSTPCPLNSFDKPESARSRSMNEKETKLGV